MVVPIDCSSGVFLLQKKMKNNVHIETLRTLASIVLNAIYLGHCSFCSISHPSIHPQLASQRTLLVCHICYSHVRLIAINLAFTENTTYHLSEFALIVTLECPIVQGFEINTRYTCVNLHRNPLPSPRLYPLKYSWVEKAQDVSPHLLYLLPFPIFHHVRHLHIQPHITVFIQMLYHFFCSICQSFFHFSLVPRFGFHIRVNASSSVRTSIGMCVLRF